MFKKDKKTIAVSSKERDASTALELKRRGYDIVKRDIVTADYQILGLPGGVRVEKKQDLSELLKSLAGNVRYNTEKECWRAYFDGTPLYYVIGERVTKSGAVINDIWDIMKIRKSDIRKENRREMIQQAVEMMQEMKDLYDVHFVFVAPDKLVDKIEELLITQPGTIYDTTKLKE